MKFGVIVFPGSNCDHDAWFAVNHNLGHHAEFIWHDSATLGDIDAVILPGGFAYGDYLRCGAIAKFSPVMAAGRKFAADGGLVLGICNGFQILVEAGLLPGALMRNRNLKFICREVRLRTETLDSPFTAAAGVPSGPGQILRMPIAHGEGRYVADERTLDELRSEEHTSELQSLRHLVCRLLLEKKCTTHNSSGTGLAPFLPLPYGSCAHWS